MCARVIARTYVQVSEQQLFSPFTSPACSPYFLVSSVAFPLLVVSETESICGVAIFVSEGERLNSWWQKGVETGGNGRDSRSHGYSPHTSPDTDRL